MRALIVLLLMIAAGLAAAPAAVRYPWHQLRTVFAERLTEGGEDFGLLTSRVVLGRTISTSIDHDRDGAIDCRLQYSWSQPGSTHVRPRSSSCDADADGSFESHLDFDRAFVWHLDTDCDGEPETEVELPEPGDQGRPLPETFALLQAELAQHRSVPCGRS